MKFTALPLAIALAAPALFSQAALAATPQGTAALSREEVQADLALWRRAGLAEPGLQEAADPTDPQFQQRLAQYRQWRSGPEFLAALRALRGEQVAGGAANVR